MSKLEKNIISWIISEHLAHNTSCKDLHASHDGIITKSDTNLSHALHNVIGKYAHSTIEE